MTTTDPRVEYARHCVRGPFKMSLSSSATEDLLAAYDELAASIPDREAAAWEACVDECNRYGGLDGFVAEFHERNPYREGEAT